MMMFFQLALVTVVIYLIIAYGMSTTTINAGNGGILFGIIVLLFMLLFRHSVTIRRNK
jgi:hypothetical protein